MTDHHIHIGQFEDVYYDAEQVFDAVFSGGVVTRLVFSSTTSCVDDITYPSVAVEIEAALKLYGLEKTAPLFWFIPTYIGQHIDIAAEMKNLPYAGFKLHPYAQKWNFENSKHRETLEAIFNYAADYGLPVLLHTGESGVDSPGRFEDFFKAYPAARCILAHGRPAHETIGMMKKYDNVYCDTAFMDEKSLNDIIAAGFGGRVLPGSDFPITHFHALHYGGKAGTALTLESQYKRDTARMAQCQKLIAIVAGGARPLENPRDFCI